MTTTPTPVPDGQCEIEVGAVSTWPGGFQGNVTVFNGTMQPVNGWTVTWKFGNGETVQQAWNSSTTQSGSTVTAKNLSWNATIAHHNAVSFGFIGSGTPGPVTAATLNGSSCIVR